MYRSNDIVRFEQNCIYIRPFVKVGEPSESVKVFKYYLEKTKQDPRGIKIEENGPDKLPATQILTQDTRRSLSKVKGIKQPKCPLKKVDAKKVEYAYSARKEFD